MSPTRRRVLVVEDDPSMREAIEHLLEAVGWSCVSCPTAEHAEAAWGAGEFTCVVTDLRLPGNSGLDLISALRRRGATAPVIAITGHDKPGLRELALERGAADYLTKPFRGTALLDAIRTACDAGSSAG